MKPSERIEGKTNNIFWFIVCKLFRKRITAIATEAYMKGISRDVCEHKYVTVLENVQPDSQIAGTARCDKCKKVTPLSTVIVSVAGQRIVHTGCYKKAYESKREATGALNRTKHLKYKLNKVYRCPNCEKWHLTKRTK